MRLFSMRTAASGLAGLLSVTAMVLALIHPGVVTQEVDLNDGGVWVTNENLHIIAHLNYPAQTLDGYIRAGSAQFDVDQSAGTVFVSDTPSDTYTRIDVAQYSMLTPLSAASAMELGGDRVGVVDPEAGSVWAMAAEDYGAFSAQTTRPVLRDEKGAVLAMGTDGSVHVASAATGRMTTVTRAGGMDDAVTTELPALGDAPDLQVSAVGDKTVVLDRASGTLVLPDGSPVALSGRQLNLQVPGPEADEVLVASADALLRVSLRGQVTEVAKKTPGGAPSRPAQHAGCAYAAWSGAGGYLIDCADASRDVNEDFPALDSASRAVFRINRKVIVLNNPEDGGLWLPDEDMVQVDNWDQINSDLEKEETEEDDTTRNADETQAERSENNTPPDAVDDSFGVRPGRSASLPVIANDTDPDGDVLVASPTSQPDLGEVVAVGDGAALQVRIRDGAAGSSTFTYELDDGTATDTAGVTLTVHPWETNAGPEQLRTSTLILGQGARSTLNVSGDWHDPDGDSVYLESVAFPAGLDVTWRADGTIAVQDLGQGAGVQELAVTYSDGRESTEGVLRVDVRGAENIAPVAGGDHVVVPEGQTVQLDPRVNDTDANGDSLRVSAIGEVPSGIGAELDPGSSVVSVTGRTAGTSYLEYTLTDGPASVTGVIRVDVIAADSTSPPVAQDDVATLPAGGEALVNVLDNDDDPGGGVLVVQSVRTGEGSPLVVALLEHHILRITAPGGLTATEEITYTVANATGTAEGRVTVIPAPATSTSDPPVLADDTLVVRAGDVGGVRVLGNDRSPAGLSMTVDDRLQHEMDPATATPFVSDDVVRVRAGDRPGSGTLVYTVHDAAGNVASASVAVNVVALDETTNTAPHPQDLTGWTVAGQKTTIAVPLDGIDAEGDSVTLVGPGSSPRLGTVETGPSALTYTAGATASGTDVFTYTVRDRLGKTATATVRVGVAPAATSNQRPVAVPDQVNIRPGTLVSIPVLDNDVDPDGDDLDLVADMVGAVDPAIEVESKGSRIRLRTPETEGTYTVEYGVSDSRSDPVTGLATVVVSAAAPLQAPIARDDAVPAAEALDHSSASVDVLDNDSDPDGDVDSDTVTSQDPGVRVGDDGELTVDVSESPRYVLYTLTDPDGLTSSAVVRVPGSVLAEPEVDPSAAGSLQVRAGQTLTIPINDYVRTRPGRTVQITDAARASASLGWDGSALVHDPTTLTFGAAADYSGPSSVTFEVTDGTDLNDSEGRVATLTLPITVLPGANRPPTLTPTEIEVAAGEKAVDVDLARWVSDPDGDDPSAMTYSAAPSLTGVSASVSGSRLSVSAQAGTASGAAGQVEVTVTDPSGATATAAVAVRVVTSTRERIQVAPISVSTGAGRAVSVDLASYATNPFPDEPLHVVGAPSASDSSSVSVSGTTLTITPPAGVSGTSTVSFRLGDKTNDASREVEGTVQVAVKDRPAPPTGVSAASNSASTASVSWTAGPANGDPVTGFTVVDETQGDSKSCGLVTTCLFEGRTNGVDHTFHVVATNGVGDSAASASATTNIDVVPGQVPQPTGSPGNGEATFTWSAPANEGSAITGYTVYLSGPGGSQQQTVTGTSATFRGLSNGGAYTATVVAANAKGSSQSQSAPSAPVVPYGAPGAVTITDVSQANRGASGSSDSVRVSWTPGDDNGRAVEYYTVTVGGASKRVSAAEGTSTVMESVATSNSMVPVSVTAVNDSAGPSGHTSPAASSSLWVLGKPVTPTGTLSLRATGASGEFTISGLSTVEGNGWPTSSQSLQWSTDQISWSSTSGTQNLGANGQTTIYVRSAASKGDGTTAYSDMVSGAVAPFGPPTAPTVSCGANGTRVTCTWQGGASGGRDTTFSLSGQENIDVADHGERSWDVGEGATVGVCTKAVQHSAEIGDRGAGGNCVSVTTVRYERRHATSRSDSAFTCTIGSCAGQTAYRPAFTLTGWPPNANVQCRGDFNAKPVEGRFTVDGAGNWSGVPDKWNWNGRDVPIGALDHYSNWDGILEPMTCSQY